MSDSPEIPRPPLLWLSLPLSLDWSLPVVISSTNALRSALYVFIRASRPPQRIEAMFWEKVRVCLMMIMTIAKWEPSGTWKISCWDTFNNHAVIRVCLAGASGPVTDIPMANYCRCDQLKRNVSAALQAHAHAGCILTRQTRPPSLWSRLCCYPPRCSACYQF